MVNMLDKLSAFIPGRGNLDQCKKRVIQEKDLFLRLCPMETVKELAISKGLETESRGFQVGSNEIIDTPLNFYELVKMVSEQVSVIEIVAFAKHKHIDTQAFEIKVRDIKAFYKIN